MPLSIKSNQIKSNQSTTCSNLTWFEAIAPNISTKLTNRAINLTERLLWELSINAITCTRPIYVAVNIIKEERRDRYESGNSQIIRVIQLHCETRSYVAWILWRTIANSCRSSFSGVIVINIKLQRAGTLCCWRQMVQSHERVRGPIRVAKIWIFTRQKQCFLVIPKSIWSWGDILVVTLFYRTT